MAPMSSRPRSRSEHEHGALDDARELGVFGPRFLEEGERARPADLAEGRGDGPPLGGLFSRSRPGFGERDGGALADRARTLPEGRGSVPARPRVVVGERAEEVLLGLGAREPADESHQPRAKLGFRRARGGEEHRERGVAHPREGALDEEREVFVGLSEERDERTRVAHARGEAG